jgi:hypothetical protein
MALELRDGGVSFHGVINGEKESSAQARYARSYDPPR